MAFYLTLCLFGDIVSGISSSRVARFFLFIMFENCEEFWVPFLPGTFADGTHGLVVSPVVLLRISLPLIGPLWGVRNAETGESTGMKNLLRGVFLAGVWLVGVLQMGRRNGEVGVWSKP
jgi:hypothetical protein